MTIEITGILRAPVMRARVRRQLEGALERLPGEPLTAQATFFDENGPKGGRALRCALTVRLPHHPTIRVEHTAETARLAFDAAFAALERQLTRVRERARDSRRRPKKYFVAAHLLAGPGEASLPR